MTTLKSLQKPHAKNEIAETMKKQEFAVFFFFVDTGEIENKFEISKEKNEFFLDPLDNAHFVFLFFCS
jgi:hypothetical protein